MGRYEIPTDNHFSTCQHAPLPFFTYTPSSPLCHFGGKNYDKDMLEASTITLAVYDADTLTRNTLIGRFVVDPLFVYYKPNHELYRQWVALADEDNADDKGIQGYIRVSVTVLGPDDHLVVHSDNDARAKDAEESSQKGVWRCRRWWWGV